MSNLVAVEDSVEMQTPIQGLADQHTLENSNYLIEIKTVQTPVFRTLSEALKEILTDVNLIFEESGLKIIAMDASHTVLVHLKLEAENFEQYYCEHKQIVGLSMINLFKLLKTMGNNDTLTIYLEKSDINRLGIKIENGEKNSVTNYKLNILDLSNENITIPPATFEYVITMPSTDFQKIIRDMNNLSETLEIKSAGQVLIFSCAGDFAVQETTIGQTHDGLSFIKNNNPDEIVQGLFELKYLVLFTKCTNLCNSIKLYLKNDYPLIIEYSVASLGNIRLCLAPKLGSS